MKKWITQSCIVLIWISCIIIVFNGCVDQEPVETQMKDPYIVDGVVDLTLGGPYIFSHNLSTDEYVESKYMFKTDTTYINVTNNGSQSITVELNFEQPKPRAPFVMQVAPGETKYFNKLIGSHLYRLFFYQNTEGNTEIQITD